MAASADPLSLSHCWAAPAPIPAVPSPQVGHWLGLYHTFQSTSNEENATGCEADLLDGGDRVGDTPPEDSPAQGGCQLGRDSCPDLPGRDPVRNYMDYSGGWPRGRWRVWEAGGGGGGLWCSGPSGAMCIVGGGERRARGGTGM